MKAPKQEKTDFEKVTIEDFTICTIVDIAYDMEHKFRGFEGAADSIKPAVRFKFEVEGYKYHHYSRWMKFVIAEKSTLYTKYIATLIEGATPEIDIDLDVLKGVKCKILWAEKNEFQYPETVRAIGKKLDVGKLPEINLDADKPSEAEEFDEFGADLELPPELQ